MFSYLLGHGYNVVMCYIIAYLLADVLGIAVALPVAFIIFILFIVPTAGRIVHPGHRFDWLKYF